MNAATCPKCSAQVPPGQAVCTACGAAIDSTSPLPDTHWVSLGAVLAIVVVLVIAVASTVVAVRHTIHVITAYSSAPAARPDDATAAVPSSTPDSDPTAAPPPPPTAEELNGAPRILFTRTAEHLRPGDIFNVEGQNLAGVRQVTMIALHDAQAARVQFKVDADALMSQRRLVCRAPVLAHPEEGAILVIAKPSGIAILCPCKPQWTMEKEITASGGAYQLMARSRINGGSHLFCELSDECSANLGDGCVAVLQTESELLSHGDGCLIYAVPGADISKDPQSRDVTVAPAINVDYDFGGEFAYKQGPGS